MFRYFLEISYPFLFSFKCIKFFIKGQCCSFYNNDVYYGFVIYTNNLYILDLDISIFNVNNMKNILYNQYISYLWHCRLGHVNEKK